jgi:predicted permease
MRWNLKQVFGRMSAMPAFALTIFIGAFLLFQARSRWKPPGNRWRAIAPASRRNDGRQFL